MVSRPGVQVLLAAVMDPFAEIRPYHDAEVRPVLDRLLNDRECVLTIARLRHPQLVGRLPWLMYPLARWQLARQLAAVADVHGLQLVIKQDLDWMMESTATAFRVSGLARLECRQPWLLRSERRGIVRG